MAIMGTCTVRDVQTNVWVDGSFLMESFDYGEPGMGVDYVRIHVYPGGYESEYMLLSGGNVQIR